MPSPWGQEELAAPHRSQEAGVQPAPLERVGPVGSHEGPLLPWTSGLQEGLWWFLTSQGQGKWLEQGPEAGQWDTVAEELAWVRCVNREMEESAGLLTGFVAPRMVCGSIGWFGTVVPPAVTSVSTETLSPLLAVLIHWHTACAASQKVP